MGVGAVLYKYDVSWKSSRSLSHLLMSSCLQSPGHILLDGDPVGSGDPAPTAAPPHFRRMPIVAKRSPISTTAELLL